MIRISFGVILVLALCACAVSNWQKPNGTSQEMAADSLACNGYIAQEESIVAVTNDGVDLDANGQPVYIFFGTQDRTLPKVAEWRHKRIETRHLKFVRTAHGNGKGGSHGGSSDARAILITAAAVIIVGAIVDDAYRARAHNECMAAYGWSPSE